jgi:hypothetical protein
MGESSDNDRGTHAVWMGVIDPAGYQAMLPGKGFG